MTILISIHATLSVCAFGLMLLVTIGFAPHLNFREHSANSLMSTFVAMSSGLVWLRLLWWSLLRPYLGTIGWMAPATFSVSGQIINSTFALGAIIAALAALGALYRSIPTAHRRNYNWLTAPLYPRRNNRVWRI